MCLQSDEVCDVFVDQVPQCVSSHSSDPLTIFCLHVCCTHHSLFDLTVKHALLLKLHHYGKLWEVSHTPQ